MNNKTNRSTAKKNRFNIVDAGVLAIILLVAVTLILVFGPFDWIESLKDNREVTIEYVVEFKDVYNSLTGNVNEGDIALISVDDGQIGRVTEVKVEPGYKWVYDAKIGAMEKKNLVNRSNIFVTVSVKCNYKRGIGYFVNERQIAVGSNLNVQFSKFEGTGYCVSIREVD